MITLTSKMPAFDKDAIAMLTADHRRIQEAFRDFERLKKRGSKRNKLEVVKQVCVDLQIHTIVENEVFYPAVNGVLTIRNADNDFIDEAKVAHVETNNLIVQLGSMKPGDKLYDAKVTVLGENINHHIEKEESVMFPLVTKAKLDLVALGDHMTMRKAQLQSEMSLSGRRTKARKCVARASVAVDSESRDS